MWEEQMSDEYCQGSKNNRPHCLYLWFLRGEAVCSEEHLNRSCAYPFWDCPARGKIPESPPENVNGQFGLSAVTKNILDDSGSV